MTKNEIVSSLLNAKRAAQVNDWERAIEAIHRVLPDMQDRAAKVNRYDVEVKKRAEFQYDIFVGGVKKYSAVSEGLAKERAAQFASRTGGQVTKAPWLAQRSDATRSS